MPQFEKADPKSVILGRGREGHRRREAYRKALASSDAGRIHLDKGEAADQVKRDLRIAAQEAGIRIRSSWFDSEQRVLMWKRTGL